MSRVICNCCHCENPIYEGDSVYDLDGLYHKECIDEMSTVEVIDLLGINASDILDYMGICAHEAEDDTEAVKEEYERDDY